MLFTIVLVALFLWVYFEVFAPEWLVQFFLHLDWWGYVLLIIAVWLLLILVWFAIIVIKGTIECLIGKINHTIEPTCPRCGKPNGCGSRSFIRRHFGTFSKNKKTTPWEEYIRHNYVTRLDSKNQPHKNEISRAERKSKIKDAFLHTPFLCEDCYNQIPQQYRNAFFCYDLSVDGINNVIERYESLKGVESVFETTASFAPLDEEDTALIFEVDEKHQLIRFKANEIGDYEPFVKSYSDRYDSSYPLYCVKITKHEMLTNYMYIRFDDILSFDCAHLGWPGNYFSYSIPDGYDQLIMPYSIHTAEDGLYIILRLKDGCVLYLPVHWMPGRSAFSKGGKIFVTREFCNKLTDVLYACKSLPHEIKKHEMIWRGSAFESRDEVFDDQKPDGEREIDDEKIWRASLGQSTIFLHIIYKHHYATCYAVEEAFDFKDRYYKDGDGQMVKATKDEWAEIGFSELNVQLASIE